MQRPITPHTLSSTGHNSPEGSVETEGARGSVSSESDARGGHASSSVEGDDTQLRRRPPGPSTRPAFIVLGLALTLTVAGAVASGLAGGNGATPTPRTVVSTAKGSPLRAEPSKELLSPITSEGLPPADVVDSIALPEHSVGTPGSALDSGVGLYDHSLGFEVAASQQDVIEFFRAQLPADLWHLVSKGPDGNSGTYRIIGQHPGSNGYEWELGVTIMPERFPASSAGDAAAKGSTPFTVRLFEVSDED